MDSMSLSNLPTPIQSPNLQLNLHLYQQGDIAFVKLATDQHEWPVKVTHYFLQRKKDKPFKKDQSSQSFSPGKKVQKKGRSSNKKQKQYQIVYKVKYYEWPSFAFVLQEQMIPFTTKLQKRLLDLNIKKLTRAIDKARFQMKIQQRIKLQKSLKRQQPNNEQKAQQQRQNIIKTPNKNSLKNKQAMNLSLAQNISKKQKKTNKKLNKSLIMNIKSDKRQNQHHKNKQPQANKDQFITTQNHSSSTQTNTHVNPLPSTSKKPKHKQKNFPKQIQPQTKQSTTQETQFPKQSSNTTTTNTTNPGQQNIIKQEYTSDNQNNNKSRIKHKNKNYKNYKLNESCSSYLEDNSQSDQDYDQKEAQLQQKNVYYLDGIFYKNKYQILGIMSDLLEDFLTRIIWIDDLNREVQEKYSQLKKRIKTLNKIIQCEIFTFQQLSRSRSLQKMLNIVKLGEIMNLPHKLITCPIKSKLIKTYKLIIKSLKNLQSSKGKSTLEKSIRSNSKASQTVDNISKTKDKQNKSVIKRKSKNLKQKSVDKSDKPKRKNSKSKPAAVKQNKSASKQKSQKKKVQKSKSQQKKKQDNNLALDQKCRLNFSTINEFRLT